MKNYIVKLLVVLFGVTNIIYAQLGLGFDFTKVGSAGLQFLKIGVGSREVSMGGAVTGAVNDANAMFWNVAGITRSEKMQASFSYNNWLVDSKFMAASATVPLGGFVLGVNVISFTINEYEETTVTNPDGTGRMVSAGDFLVGVGVARQFTDKLSIGGQIKYVHEKLDDYSLDNVLFDIGTLYYTGWRNLRLAFSLQHFGPDMKLVNQSFRTPLLFRLSATDELFDFETVKMTLAAELVHPTDNYEWVNVGTEINFMEYFFVRSGYRFNVGEGKLSLGAGVITPSVNGVQTKFDYAFVKSEKVFDDIHRVTISLMF